MSPPDAGKVGALGACLLFFVAAAPASGQTEAEVLLDTNPQLFAVLCAARAAASPERPPVSDSPLAARVDAALARLDPAVVAPLRNYFREKHRADTPPDLSSYVSLALMLGPAPDFDWQVPRDHLPPDAWELQDFPPVLRTFYAQAGIESLWRQLQPAYEEALAQWRPDVANTLLEARGYLRLGGESHLGRSYTIYLEWLVPVSLTSARNYGEDYFLVLHPQRSELLEAVRHQYLHFVVDPLVTKHAKQFAPWSRLLPLAAQAPRLPGAFRQDVLLLATECLIQAMELRFRHLDLAAAGAELDSRERAGYVFVRHFYDALQKYEEDEPALRYYFPDLLRGYDPDYERARLARMEFASAEPAVRAARPGTPAADQAATRLLREGESRLAERNYEAAREAFERVLREADPNHPGALYGLALVASAEQDRAEAKRYFLRALEHAHAPHILGWTHVYLGRIYDLEGNRDLAVAHYQAALAANTREERVERAAREGLQRPYGQNQTPWPGPRD